VEATGLTPGWHAIHVHEKGDCSSKDFNSAGAHANPQQHAHGALDKEGMHAGDMPNVWAHADGVSKSQFFLHGVRLKGDAGLLDEDGAAVVIHASADDHSSQPSGAAGDRVACGVIGAD
jgi:Cu-Zn family superoxide dismutase